MASNTPTLKEHDLDENGLERLPDFGQMDEGQTHFVGDDCQPPHSPLIDEPAATEPGVNTAAQEFADWLAEKIYSIDAGDIDEAEITAVRHGCVINVKVSKMVKA